VAAPFDAFHALPLILLGLILARRFGSAWLMPFLLSIILHVFGDLPPHHDDAHAHFFPLSDWHFESPVSYWDTSYYGNIFTPVEAVITIVGSVVLFRRYPSFWTRGLVASVGGIYLAYWGVVFWMWV